VVAEPQGPVEVANRLRHTLLLLNRQLRRETHALGVSGGQVTLLVTIRDRPGIGVGELAARERVSPPSMSAAIDRLEAAGLVTRSREQATDRRRVGLTVTADALRVLRAVKSRRTAWLAERLRALSPAELAAVDAAVEPLARLLDTER
jgi:DNA-binding MarR family transcriptional regulator